MAVTGVYRTERGTILRIVQVDGSAARVELLKNETWVPGPIGMAGLRLSRSTRQLTEAAIRKLPA